MRVDLLQSVITLVDQSRDSQYEATAGVFVTDLQRLRVYVSVKNISREVAAASEELRKAGIEHTATGGASTGSPRFFSFRRNTASETKPASLPSAIRALLKESNPWEGRGRDLCEALQRYGWYEKVTTVRRAIGGVRVFLPEVQFEHPIRNGSYRYRLTDLSAPQPGFIEVPDETPKTAPAAPVPKAPLVKLKGHVCVSVKGIQLSGTTDDITAILKGLIN